jgi:hypothetical protein
MDHWNRPECLSYFPVVLIFSAVTGGGSAGAAGFVFDSIDSAASGAGSGGESELLSVVAPIAVKPATRRAIPETG